MADIAKGCNSGNSYFVSVQKSSVWVPKNGHSLFNPEYVLSIDDCMAKLLGEGKFSEDQILVLSYYAEEQRDPLGRTALTARPQEGPLC
jgi:hypothetical protein